MEVIILGIFLGSITLGRLLEAGAGYWRQGPVTGGRGRLLEIGAGSWR